MWRFGIKSAIYLGMETSHSNLPDDVDAFNYKNATPGLLVDAAVSGVLDTLLLPYTIYKQQADGSIEIN